jgi:hypothetical protein
MLIDRYDPEDVFAQVPEVAAQADPVLKQLDILLEDDQLSRQVRAEVEFGRHVILDEVEGGIVTRYAILEQPNEHGQAVEAVNHHQQVFGRAPRLVAGDRGVHSADTEEVLTAAG